jgi:CBS domain containing-hemolysin-like protein
VDGGQEPLKGNRPNRRNARRLLTATLLSAAVCVFLAGAGAGGRVDAAGNVPGGGAEAVWHVYLPVSVIMVVLGLLVLSAFFSSCETAFLSIQKPRLRSMREEKKIAGRWVARMLENPGRLLTTILVGNMVVNTLIGVILGTRVKDLFEDALGLPAAAAYATAVAVCTSLLLFLGEITPKIIAVRTRETYARLAVAPLMAADRALAPLRDGLLRLTEFLFRVTRFHELHAAPFITDEELKSALTDDQATGVIEEEGREMIRRILEFHDVHLREILIPRPDVVALPGDATVAEAHAQFREHEYSRVPVYQEDLDHIVGVLFAKDLLPSLSKGEPDRPVRTLARPPHFVPETMSVRAFIKDVQRLRSHLAIVVDEYGGTEGIVTLHDAIEQVVGDIRDEGEEERLRYEQVAPNVYRVQGSLSLDELSDLIHVPIEDKEHNTVAGFLMAQTEKVPGVGDHIRYLDAIFTVEKVKGKRASVVRIEIVPDAEEGAS